MLTWGKMRASAFSFRGAEYENQDSVARCFGSLLPVVALPRGMPPSPIRRLLPFSLAPRIIDIGPIHFAPPQTNNSCSSERNSEPQRRYFCVSQRVIYQLIFTKLIIKMFFSTKFYALHKYLGGVALGSIGGFCVMVNRRCTRARLSSLPPPTPGKCARSMRP